MTLWAQVGQWNHVLDGVQVRPCEGAIFREKHVPGMLEDTAVSCAKMAEVIEIVCGFGIRVGRMKRR